MKKISVFAAVAAALTATLALGACDFTQNALVPSVTGQPVDQPPAIVPLDVAALGAPSATPIGARIGRFRTDLTQLQQAGAELSQRYNQLHADAEANISAYQTTAGSMRTMQQGGAGRDDPAMAAAWQNTQTQLQMVGADLDQLNLLSNNLVNNVAFSAYLLQSIRGAKNTPGATDEDRRQLNVLDGSATGTASALDQLLTALSGDLRRHSRFLGIERANLAEMAPTGAAAGSAVAAAQSVPPPRAPGAGLSSGRPFVIIRFDDPDVAYEPQFQEAVSAALGRLPNLAFDLVAVAAPAGAEEQAAANAEAARTNARKVMRSLLDMGVPAERISLSEVTDPNIYASEVHLYVR